MLLSFAAERIPALRSEGNVGRFLIRSSWVTLILSTLALVCATIYLLMIFLLYSLIEIKYQDKDERGTI